jgi:hypothetical protein
MASELTEEAPASTSAALVAIPAEVCLDSLAIFFGTAQPIGRLAAASPCLLEGLKDSSGRLRVSAIVTGRLRSAIEGLQRANLHELRVFRLDLSGESRDLLSKQEIEQGIRQLGTSLSEASSLEVMAVRLASFDASMERLRLGMNAWEALIRCLGELACYKRLRSLELSSISIKTSRATQDVNMIACSRDAIVQESSSAPRVLRRAATSPTRGAGAAAAAGSSLPKLSFLDALARMSNLEELVLAYDEIFGNTAEMLPPVFHKMHRLKRVDLTRNYISKQVMEAVRAAMPKKVDLCGADLQTFYFY